MGLGRFGRLLIGVATLALAVTGCGRSSGPAAGTEIDGAAYVAALRPFLPPAAGPAAPKRSVVFVVPLDGRALPLELQIEVVDALADGYDVRFVDDASAAIDEQGSHQPPQEGGVLIGVAPVTGDVPHSTRVEVYWDDDRVEGHLVTLAVDDDGRWQVARDEPVTPESLSRHG